MIGSGAITFGRGFIAARSLAPLRLRHHLNQQRKADGGGNAKIHNKHRSASKDCSATLATRI